MTEETGYQRIIKYWENRLLKHEYFLLGSIGVVLGFTFQHSFSKPNNEIWWMVIVGWILLVISFISGTARQYFVLLLLSIDAEIANLEDNKSKEQNVDNSEVDEEIQKYRKDRDSYNKPAAWTIWVQLTTFLVAIIVFVGFKSVDLYFENRELKDFTIKEYNIKELDLRESIKEVLELNGYSFNGYDFSGAQLSKATLAKIDYAVGNSIKTAHAICTQMFVHKDSSYWKIELIDKAAFNSL